MSLPPSRVDDSTRLRIRIEGVHRLSPLAAATVARQSITGGALIVSPSSSTPASLLMTPNGTSMPDMPSRCLRRARRVFLMPPLSSRSPSRTITVSAAPSLAEEPRVPVSISFAEVINTDTECPGALRYGS